MMSLNCYVSFARTPLTEIGEKVERIKALGWSEDDEYGRGDPWVAAFQKDVPETDPDPTRELREVMGDDWIDADGIMALLASKGSPLDNLPWVSYRTSGTKEDVDAARVDGWLVKTGWTIRFAPPDEFEHDYEGPRTS